MIGAKIACGNGMIVIGCRRVMPMIVSVGVPMIGLGDG
jgi:hypothetical protein